MSWWRVCAKIRRDGGKSMLVDFLFFIVGSESTDELDEIESIVAGL